MPAIVANASESSIFNFPLMIPEKLHLFVDRKEAGEKLGLALAAYREQNPLVLAIPPGGAEVGLELAKSLKGDFSLVISKKIPYPGNPEMSFGAVAEDGNTYVHIHVVRGLSPDTVSKAIMEKSREIQGDIASQRRGRDLLNISGRTVILTDEGLIEGSTMKAAFLLCRKRKAAKIIVAVPVSGKNVMKELKWFADDVVALETMEPIYSPSQIYARWSSLSDREVGEILTQWDKSRRQRALIATPMEG